MVKHFVVRIEKVQPGSSLEAGKVFSPVSQRAVIGRSSDADIQINDMSISREHLSLEATDAGFAVSNLTERGSTYVNAERLEPGQSVEIEGNNAWLQVGHALLKVSAMAQTMQVDNLMSLPLKPQEDTANTSFVQVQHQPFLRIWVGGHLVSLFPSTARVLARLCESPGEAVLQEELLEAIDPEFHLKSGGANLAQNITYLRDMFDLMLDEGQLDEGALREMVEASGVGGRAPSKNDRRTLLRAVVSNVRGVGYRLCLPAESISVEHT